MKKALTTAALVTAVLALGAGPAAALSCMEPEPYDMRAAIDNADAAAAGTITSILASTETEYGDARLVVYVEVTEVYKGTVPARLTLERDTTIWGPWYEEGTELAMLITNGVVADGQNSLCGPFFYPDDMRSVAGEPTSPAPMGPLWHLLDMVRFLVGLLGHLLA